MTQKSDQDLSDALQRWGLTNADYALMAVCFSSDNTSIHMIRGAPSKAIFAARVLLSVVVEDMTCMCDSCTDRRILAETALVLLTGTVRH